MGGEKKSLVHTAHAQFPQDFWEFPVRYTNLCERCQLFLHERCLPLTMLCVNDDEGAIKAYNKLFAYRNYPCVRPFQLNAMACD